MIKFRFKIIFILFIFVGSLFMLYFYKAGIKSRKTIIQDNISLRLQLKENIKSQYKVGETITLEEVFSNTTNFDTINFVNSFSRNVYKVGEFNFSILGIPVFNKIDEGRNFDLSFIENCDGVFKGFPSNKRSTGDGQLVELKGYEEKRYFFICELMKPGIYEINSDWYVKLGVPGKRSKHEALVSNVIRIKVLPR